VLTATTCSLNRPADPGSCALAVLGFGANSAPSSYLFGASQRPA
jgi:hypothetical protein